MFIEKLSILNFKNFKAVDFQPQPTINCFVGNNGAGKTNLLDAIYYMSFCKSYFNNIDYQNINYDESFFMIQGRYIIEDKPHSLVCSVKKGDKKLFKFNDKEYPRLADHIGFIPLVIISPSDTDYINEGSNMRRKFMDVVISQYDRAYLDNLMNYNKALLQRNTLLKSFFENSFFDRSLLDMWDDKLITLGHKIFDRRETFIESLLPLFQEYYQTLSGGCEQVSIAYDSQLHKNTLENLLSNSLYNDRKALFTTVGIHKDDLVFSIDNVPLKKFGSQGQQKTFLIALKLSQYKITKEIKMQSPILLLDDVFDKLDNKRVAFLMTIVGSKNFGQVFITDTDPERVQRVLAEASIDAALFNVDANNIKKL